MGTWNWEKLLHKSCLIWNWKKRIDGYHVLLSNIYAEEAKWENVDRVRNHIKEKGLQKEMACSWVEIVGSVNYFVARDEKHPLSGEIYYILGIWILESSD